MPNGNNGNHYGHGHSSGGSNVEKDKKRGAKSKTHGSRVQKRINTSK